MDALRFEERLEVWLDGELPPDEAAEMEAWCAAHTDARVRADAERAFAERVRQALLSGEGADGASGRDVVLQALAKARQAAEPAAAPVAPAPAAVPAPRGRRLALPRWATGAAAAAAVAVTAMWMNCIPPFECPYIEALEATARAPAAGAAELDGAACECVPLANGVRALRTRVPVPGGEAVVLLAETPGHHPSFRRERTLGGETWWIASEGGRTLVSFQDPRNRGLWCFVGSADEATLVGAARALRSRLAAQSSGSPVPGESR